MTKKNFDEQKKEICNNLKASIVMVFDINILANITLMGKIPQKYYKSQKLTKFTSN